MRFVYKNFPLTTIHPWAETAAIGAHCAYEQSPEAFWKVHDAIFDDQDAITPENVWDKLVSFASQAGLNADTFKACLSSADAQKAVDAEHAEGVALGVDSTPTAFVNGRPLAGGDPRPSSSTSISSSPRRAWQKSEVATAVALYATQRSQAPASESTNTLGIRAACLVDSISPADFFSERTIPHESRRGNHLVHKLRIRRQGRHNPPKKRRRLTGSIEHSDGKQLTLKTDYAGRSTYSYRP